MITLTCSGLKLMNEHGERLRSKPRSQVSLSNFALPLSKPKSDWSLQEPRRYRLSTATFKGLTKLGNASQGRTAICSEHLSPSRGGEPFFIRLTTYRRAVVVKYIRGSDSIHSSEARRAGIGFGDWVFESTRRVADRDFSWSPISGESRSGLTVDLPNLENARPAMSTLAGAMLSSIERWVPTHDDQP